ncbi:MAG: glycosyltransferase [Spirochaetaceae bacterium]|nr:glycosyltransferase [Spirochaetaceae bacterium]
MKDVTVGLFNDCYVPIMDGVTLTVRNYAYWLNKTLGPTYVVTPYVPQHVDNEPFPVIRFLSLPTIVRPPYRFGIPDLDLRLQILLKRRDFSIIHAHSPFGAGQVALKTAREKGVPIVATFHSKYRDDLQRVMPIKPIVDDQIKRIVEFYYSVNHVWVPQESVAATLREYGYKGPYKVVENGIDLKPPATIAPFRERGAAHLGLPEDLFVGLFVGQHIFEKNLELLVRSLPAVMDAVPNFRMVFVGQGYAKERLKEIAAELGIAEKIVFHDVVYDREILKSIYARADLFLFPSLYDNAPLVVREAAAFRTPALLIKGSTAAEVIKDGENGFLSPNDPVDYAARIVSIVGDRRGLETAGFGAQRTLCKSWEDVLREVRDQYLEILSHWAR